MTRVSELYYEEIGTDFECFMSPYDVKQRQRLIECLMRRCGKLGTCLEVGCGTGAISRWLIDRVEALTVCDLSEKLSERVGKGVECEWRQADACDLPFGDGTFDAVVSSECIEHTPEPLVAIAEMARVLRPGGVLMLTTPNKLWYPSLVLARRLGVRRFAGNEVWLFPGAIKRQLERSRMEVLARRGCHLVPWQVPGARFVLPAIDRLGAGLYPLMINFGVAARKRT